MLIFVLAAKSDKMGKERKKKKRNFHYVCVLSNWKQRAFKKLKIDLHVDVGTDKCIQNWTETYLHNLTYQLNCHTSIIIFI